MSIHYYNCGDWVESCTALVELDDGTIRIVDGVALVEQLREQKRQVEVSPSPAGDRDRALIVKGSPWGGLADPKAQALVAVP